MKSILSDTRFHLFLEVRHRTAPSGVPEDWTCNDRFRVHHGPEGGLLYVYRSIVQTDEAAQSFLAELGCGSCIAFGHFRAGEKKWGFEEPQSSPDCLELIQRLVADDADILRYFGNYHVVAPNGHSCGIIRDFAI